MIRFNKFSLFFLSLSYSFFVHSQIVNDNAITLYDTIKNSYTINNTHTAFKPSFIYKDHKIEEFDLKVTPVFDFLLGLQNEYKESEGNTSVLRSSLGLQFQVSKSRFNFSFTYLNNYGKYMHYQNGFIQKNRVLPSTNVVSKDNKFVHSDYINSFLNYKANDHFEFELGYGRNFIGDGYRSLLLSDFANASPYLKINTSFWKIKYTTLFTAHQNIFNVEGKKSSYQKKYTATHFLDWQVTKWLTVGLFESIIWQAEEETYTRGFDPNYLNPVIFYRPVEFSVGSSDNALVGTNIKFTLKKKYIIYTQLIFDEFLLSELKADLNQYLSPEETIQSGWWANKYGIQLGWTAFDFFNVTGLQTRFELNLVRPYTYAHSSPTQAYSNYNLSLAHPLGANFHEFVSIVNYTKNRWLLRLQYNQSRKGKSPQGLNLGEEVELSNSSRFREYENRLTQGIPVVTQFAEFSVGYVVKQDWNATFSAGLLWRTQRVETEKVNNNMLYLAFKTNLFNQYWDH